MHFNYGQCKGFQYVLCSMCCMNYVFILFVVSFYISMCLNFKEWFFLTLLFFLCHVFSWWLYVYYVDYIFYAMYLYVLKNQIMVHFSLGDCMFIMLSIFYISCSNKEMGCYWAWVSLYLQWFKKLVFTWPPTPLPTIRKVQPNPDATYLHETGRLQ
jgi:hypothetical protein